MPVRIPEGYHWFGVFHQVDSSKAHPSEHSP